MRLPQLEAALVGKHNARYGRPDMGAGTDWFAAAYASQEGGFIIKDPRYPELVVEVVGCGHDGLRAAIVLWCYFATEVNGARCSDPVVKYRVTVTADGHLDFEPIGYERLPWGPFRVVDQKPDGMRGHAPVIERSELEQYARDFDEELRRRGWVQRAIESGEEARAEELGDLDWHRVQWVMVAEESGPGSRARAHAWARRLRAAWVTAGAAVFFTQRASPRAGCGPPNADGAGGEEIPISAQPETGPHSRKVQQPSRHASLPRLLWVAIGSGQSGLPARSAFRSAARLAAMIISRGWRRLCANPMRAQPQLYAGPYDAAEVVEQADQEAIRADDNKRARVRTLVGALLRACFEKWSR